MFTIHSYKTNQNNFTSILCNSISSVSLLHSIYFEKNKSDSEREREREARGKNGTIKLRSTCMIEATRETE